MHFYLSSCKVQTVAPDVSGRRSEALQYCKLYPSVPLCGFVSEHKLVGSNNIFVRHSFIYCEKPPALHEIQNPQLKIVGGEMRCLAPRFILSPTHLYRLAIACHLEVPTRLIISG